MKLDIKHIIISFLALFVFVVNINADDNVFKKYISKKIHIINLSPQDTIKDDDTTKLPYSFNDYNGNPYSRRKNSSPFYLKRPSNIKTTVEYDPVTKKFIFKEKVGNLDYRNPYPMSSDEYNDFQMKNSMSDNWKRNLQKERKAQQSDHRFLDNLVNQQLNFNVQGLDKVFGSNVIEIKPQGSAELIFGINISRVENPTLPENLQKSVTFDFDEKIQMGVTGQIGEKMKLGINYNTEATFDFENQTTISYTGNEDEILQSIEAGNVSLPLTGTLITGSHSLFGIKTKLKFGKLTITSILSQQKGESSTIEIQGGAQINQFELRADDYEKNKHFFLSQYFKDSYNGALANLPLINSGVTVTRIEIWVTNRTGNFENSRNIIAFMDLAEASGSIFATHLISQIKVSQYPENKINSLYDMMINIYSSIRDINKISSVLKNLEPRFVAGQDYEKVENARLLSPTEYSINKKLGYISLNSALNADEVLAVAYEYSIGSKIYKVGEFANAGINAPNTLVLKLIKGTSLTPKYPTWKLMMKNVYPVGAYQVNSQDFNLNILYQNDKTGNNINYIPEGAISGQILLRVLNLDRLNTQLDNSPDGLFDFIDGVTIKASNGRIFFPVLEPFGADLRKKFSSQDIADKFVFDELYDSTQSQARQFAQKNKFILKGSYRSAGGSEINLNAMNVPQGSVKVTAGGMELVEGTDYLVDYTLGRVTILNHGLLESGTPIQISLESNSLFNIGTKNLFGTHLDYRFSDNFTLSGTILRLTEKPLTNKVNIGDEPISNTIWGIDGTYSTEVPFLTKLVDKIPFIETKEKSTIEISGEFAYLVPGHSKSIGRNGVSYIDDFEGSKTRLDIKSQSTWVLASTPQGQQSMFPEGNLTNDLTYGYNRAKLAWYNVISDFVRIGGASPSHITDDDQSNHMVREVYEKEIFPNKESPNGYPTALSVLNLAYYPSEKGPYNFEVDGVNGFSAGINANGSLKIPSSRWAGIMRKIQTNDFEAANIEFIEFWVMNPFADDENHSGGDLYFNLGNISEDILKDSRKSFENGLPNSSEVKLVDTTTWGRVPITQSLVNAFDNNPESRIYQDVGLDGLSDNDETDFFKPYLNSILNSFGSGSDAYKNAVIDPSNDNYHFFKGSDYDQQKLSILDRYKQFNGLEGNSPTADLSPESYPTSATLIPNVEDINLDNTLSENESYYQYKISIRPEDMKIGTNYITNIIESNVTLKNKKEVKVKWYQFKIPIYEPNSKIGVIDGFQSIRFIRMFLKDFEKDIVMRFAKLDLIRGEWRKYRFDLSEGSEVTTYPQKTSGTFDVSAVNIEENGTKSPVNYILPPGIDRIIDPTNPQMRQLNEQAIMLKVLNLEDGGARAAYKNVSMDVRQYKKLQMEIHAEAIENFALKDYELSVFIRVGSDYKENYYEYEIPLILTQPGFYSNDIEQDRYRVWPTDNKLEVEFEIFQKLKQLRNTEMRRQGTSVSYTSPFTIKDGKNKVVVVGNPNLSNIKTIMIGIRNPNRNTNLNVDDGLDKSGEIWLNELRLTDFNEKGGWATNARIATRFADFATLTMAGHISKPGFGSIEKKVNERQKEEILQYDISSSVELGRFFPSKYRVRIPVYMGISESFSNPQYNPLDPDILLKTTLSDPSLSSNEKDSIKRIVQDYTKRRSFNVTNLKIEGKAKRKKKKRFYHVSNWSTSYAYNEAYSRNINVHHNLQKNYSGSISYIFNNRPKNIVPFRKVKFLRRKAFRIIRDINFYYQPVLIALRNEMTKSYNETQLRDINNMDMIIEPSFKKDFLWNRTYDIKYNLSRAMKFQFTASNISRIDEPYGRIDKSVDDYKIKRDSIWNNIFDMGRNTQYNHTINASYTLPINKLPFLYWTNVTARYRGMYDWQSGPITADTIKLGNTIKNSNSIQLSGQFNFRRIYNKSKYLRDIEKKIGKGDKSQKRFKEVNFEKKNINFKPDKAKSITHRLMTEDVTVKVYDENGKEITGKLSIINANRIKFKTSKKYKKAKVVIKGRKEVKDNFIRRVVDNSVYFLMGLKNISVAYTENNGTIMPGYMPKTKIAGLQNYNNVYAPGWEFITGIQDDDFPIKATNNNWITKDTLLNLPYKMTHTSNLNIRATIEPIKDLRIDLTANRTFTQNKTEFWIADNNGDFNVYNKMLSGNFSMSYNTIFTSFQKFGKDYYSKAYENFKENRYDIAWRLANERLSARKTNSPEYNPAEANKESDEDVAYPKGYSQYSQEVLIPSFLAAYSNKTSSKINLSAFPLIPKLNWRIVYKGLTNIDFTKHIFKTINLMHAYRSTYNVGSYVSNPAYSFAQKDYDGYSWVTEEIKDLFIPEQEISTVSINEQFSPLISVDVVWFNNLNTRFEYKKSRNLSLSLANNQLIETASTEFLIGLGYRFEELPIIIKNKGKQKKYQSDLNIRADLSIRDMMTIIRKLDESINQLTAGQKNTSIKISADYMLSKRFNIRVFYDHVINSPKISTSFKNSNIKIGISIRFTLIP